MITFHVGRHTYQQFKLDGKITLVRDRVKTWTDKFKTELDITFPERVGKNTGKVEGLPEGINPTCLVKLQNLNEVITATVVSVSLEQDHLGKWKYVITLTCMPVWDEDNDGKRPLSTWSQLIQTLPAPGSRKKLCAAASVLAALGIILLMYVLWF